MPCRHRRELINFSQDNEAFKSENYTDAVSLYTSAIEVIIELDPSSYYCLLNRSLAQAYLRLKRCGLRSKHIPKVVLIQEADFFRWSLAESEATKALDADPKDVTAFIGVRWLGENRATMQVQGKISAYVSHLTQWAPLTRDSVSTEIKLFLEAGGNASVSESELARIPGFEVADAETLELKKHVNVCSQTPM
jgi:hypothetical protein